MYNTIVQFKNKTEHAVLIYLTYWGFGIMTTLNELLKNYILRKSICIW